MANPYQAEALRIIGDISLEERSDVAAAERAFSSAIRILQKAQKSSREFDKYRVPAASTQRTAPPANMRSLRGWGNLEWFTPESHQIINADTCPWYIGHQLQAAHLQRSLCYFVQGKIEQAVEDIGVISTIDENDRALTERNMPSHCCPVRKFRKWLEEQYSQPKHAMLG